MELSFQFASESDYSDEFSGCLSPRSLGSISGGSSSAREGKIKVRNDSHARCLASLLAQFKDRITCMAVVGEMLYVGSESGRIQIVQLNGEIMRRRCSDAVVKALLVDGDKLYSAHQDKKIRIWSRTPRDVFKFQTTLPTVTNQLKSFMRSGNMGRGQKPVWIKHVDVIASLALNVEDNLLYSGSWDKTVKVWRLSDFECVESINAHDDAVNAIVTGARGMLFTGSADETIKVWRFVGWGGKSHHHESYHQLITTIKPPHGPAAPVNALALSPDESILYSGTSKGSVNFWVIDEGSLQICYGGALWGHRRSVLCLTTAGKFVCSGSADKSVRIWMREGADISAGHSCFAVLEGHAGPVKCIASAISPSSLFPFLRLSSPSSSPCSPHRDKASDDDADVGGLGVYSGSLDGNIKIWWVNPSCSCA